MTWRKPETKSTQNQKDKNDQIVNRRNEAWQAVAGDGGLSYKNMLYTPNFNALQYLSLVDSGMQQDFLLKHLSHELKRKLAMEAVGAVYVPMGTLIAVMGERSNVFVIAGDGQAVLNLHHTHPLARKNSPNSPNQSVSSLNSLMNITERDSSNSSLTEFYKVDESIIELTVKGQSSFGGAQVLLGLQSPVTITVDEGGLIYYIDRASFAKVIKEAATDDAFQESSSRWNVHRVLKYLQFSAYRLRSLGEPVPEEELKGLWTVRHPFLSFPI